MMMCPRSGLERLNNTYRHALAEEVFWRSKQLAIVLGFLDDSRTNKGGARDGCQSGGVRYIRLVG